MNIRNGKTGIMGNPWNRIIKNAMYDISGLPDWSFRSYVDYNTKITSLIDGRYFKTVPDCYDILISSMSYIAEGHSFYMFKQNKDHNAFPSIQFVFLDPYNKKEKEITPAYIRDIDDFRHYFKYCMDYVEELNRAHEYKLKKKALAEKKYVANSDDFENKIYNLFDKYKIDVSDITRSCIIDGDISDPYTANVNVYVKDIDIKFFVMLSTKDYSVQVVNCWVNCDCDVDFNSKEFSTLEKQILHNSNKADIEKYIDLVIEKI